MSKAEQQKGYGARFKFLSEEELLMSLGLSFWFYYTVLVFPRSIFTTCLLPITFFKLQIL